MSEQSRTEPRARTALILEIGGFRPPDDPFASWFGKVMMAADGEEWPSMDSTPMHALCQLNLDNLPYRPVLLEDVAFLTLFIGPEELPVDMPNGQNWCLRTYTDLSSLRPMNLRETGSWIKPFPIRPDGVVDDYPCGEDALEFRHGFANDLEDKFVNRNGFKLGGWPTLIQHSLDWGPEHPLRPEFVFQIDTTEKGNWMWGDNGIGYFGRGTQRGYENEWALSWQCL